MDRFAKFHSLMEKVGVKQLWRQDGSTYFNFAAWGFAGSGWRLAFMHSPAKQSPSPLTSSIDSPHTYIGVGPDIVYRALGDDWYVRVLLE